MDPNGTKVLRKNENRGASNGETTQIPDLKIQVGLSTIDMPNNVEL